MMLLESILSILTFITFAPRSLALPPGIPVDTVESEAPSPGDAFPGLGYSSLPGEPADRRDDTPFANLCREVTLGGHGKPGVTTIDGKCIDALSGLWWETSLNLNKCLGNAGGRLVYMANGNFDEKCRPCTLNNVEESDDLMLKCNCMDVDGIPRYTQLQLGFEVPHDLAVKPVHGRFTCGQTIGFQEPIY